MIIRIEVKVNEELVQAYECDLNQSGDPFKSFWGFIKTFQSTMKTWSFNSIVGDKK